MNVTTEHSTYTYETGAQETVTLSRGPLTPHGHARLKIEYSDGQIVDCYVNTAWLRDRLNDLGEPRRLTPDAITDEMIQRARKAWNRSAALGDDLWRDVLTAALTEPTRPEGAEKIEGVLHLYWSGDIDGDDLADRIAEEMNR